MRRAPLAVTWVPGDPGTAPKVAYAIGRGVGGAVVRNRVRRRLRAAVYELAPSLAPGVYLIGAAPEAASLSFGELRSRLSEALEAVTGRGPA